MNTTSVPMGASPGHNSSFTAQAAAQAALDLGPLLVHLLLQAASADSLCRPSGTSEKSWRVVLVKAEEEGFLRLDRARGRLPRAALTKRGLEVLQALGVQGDVQGEPLKSANLCGSTVSCQKTQAEGEAVGDHQGDQACPPPFDPPSYAFRFSQHIENKRKKSAGFERFESSRRREAREKRSSLFNEIGRAEVALLAALGPTLAARAGGEGTLSSRASFWLKKGLIDQALALARQAAKAKTMILRPMAWIDSSLSRGRGSAALAAERARMAEDSKAAAGRAAFQAACLAAGAATPGEREAVALQHLKSVRQKMQAQLPK